MTQFVAALTVFLVLHMVPAIPALRARLVSILGRKTYLFVYSAASLLALFWLFAATFLLDFLPLWDPAPWQAWVPLILTPLGLVFLIAGLLSPNPASITLRRPGAEAGAIITITRHPVLWGFALWAGSHLVPNGDLRSLLLFGSLFAFALLGMLTGDRRARRSLGERWPALANSSSLIPFAAILAGRTRLRLDAPLLIGVLLSAALTAWLLLGLHAALFMADPLAMAAL